MGEVNSLQYSRSTQKPVKITLLPYYGGAKGHTLQIAEMPNGKVTTTIIKTPTTTESTTIEQEEETTTQLIEIEYPQLPTKHDYSANLKNIHQNALNIIKLQEQQKTQGSLTETEQQIFKESVDSLHESSDNLARLQEHDDDYEDDSGGTLESWFERKKNNKVNKEKNKNSEKNKEGSGNSSNNNNNKESGQKEEEEGDGEDGIAINLPPEDASVAEAKPVGLAIAGTGGVAASKPIATAVVGPGGLAIARPVGTAIAGVSPDQALVPIYAEGFAGGVKPGKGGKETSSSEYINKLINRFHQHY